MYIFNILKGDFHMMKKMMLSFALIFSTELFCADSDDDMPCFRRSSSVNTGRVSGYSPSIVNGSFNFPYHLNMSYNSSIPGRITPLFVGHQSDCYGFSQVGTPLARPSSVSGITPEENFTPVKNLTSSSITSQPSVAVVAFSLNALNDQQEKQFKRIQEKLNKAYQKIDRFKKSDFSEVKKSELVVYEPFPLEKLFA